MWALRVCLGRERFVQIGKVRGAVEIRRHEKHVTLRVQNLEFDCFPKTHDGIF